VHGDVYPSSIMLKRTGNAKLIDIGTAFARDDAPSHAGLHRAHGS
jgi:serine/threonine-protein kinase